MIFRKVSALVDMSPIHDPDRCTPYQPISKSGKFPIPSAYFVSDSIPKSYFYLFTEPLKEVGCEAC